MNKQTLLAQINSKLSKTIATIDHHAKKTLLKKISSTLDHAIKTCDDKWITVNGGSKKDGEGGGSHILLDDNGHIKAGAGGKFNGQKLNSMGGTQKFTKYQTNAERSGKTKKEKELHQVRNSLMMGLDIPQEYKFSNGAFHQLRRSINDGSLRLIGLGNGKNKDETHFKSLHEQLKRERDIFNYVKDRPELHNDFDIKKLSKDDVKKMMQQSSTNKPSQEATQVAESGQNKNNDKPEDTNRLKTLKASLEKKEAELNRRFDTHFDFAKSTNGQPLNDKGIKGQRALNKMDKQNDAIRNQMKEIEKTKAAIEREEDKHYSSDATMKKMPSIVQEMHKNGELKQWRKFPDHFFVDGVDKARIQIKDGKIYHKYLNQVTDKEQYKKFAQAFNKIAKSLKGED